jgi:uncharacterized DUF497 family protein
MFERHHVTTHQADQALHDPERVVIQPDYASRSGESVRVIGFCPSLGDMLTVIVVVDEGGHEYGASAWKSNQRDRHIYHHAKEGNA